MGLALAYLEDRYPGFPDAKQDWASEGQFRAQLKHLDGSSSPGWPYMREAGTIREWLKTDPLGRHDEMQVQRLWYDTRCVLEGSYEHLHRVFVKGEPHKKAKAEQNRWRLIVAFSLPVQMAWRMAFAEQNHWLNERPYDTPSAHGLVFSGGGWMRFKAHARTRELVYSRDISGWDIGAPGWVLDLVARFRKSRGFSVEDQHRNQVIDRLYEDAFGRARLLFSNGNVVEQQFRGFQKSGSFNTIADNSLAMVAMHAVACLRSGMPFGEVWATGDDVLQSNLTEPYLEALESLGCKVKEWEKSLTFMGTCFDAEPEPVYFQKHLVAMASQEAELRAATLDSYCRLYAYSTRFQFWWELSRLWGVSLHSRAYYRFWYGSPAAQLLGHLLGKFRY